MINLAFGGLQGFRRSKRTPRPAVSPAVLRPISLPQASTKIAEKMPSEVKVVDRRKTLTAAQQRTQPMESPKPSRSSGGMAGTARKRKPTSVGNDTTVPMGPVFLRGPQRNTVISHTEFDESAPPPPIEVAYEVGQTGSPKRLNEYKKMYRGSTYDLATPTLKVGGTSTNKDKKFRPSTMAGFGRKNVVWPYWLHDYYAGADDQLTSATSCFNRTQIQDVLFKMWEATTGLTDTQLSDLIQKIEDTVGGDVRVDFPLDYIECEYKYFNNNIATPIDLSLYICTPVRDLTGKQNPMHDWFDPGTADESSDPELMFPAYYYEPTLTAAEKVMFTNTAGTMTDIKLKANKDSILCASTEVVPEATPQGFSVKFRRNWKVMHVQPFLLMPQQELKVKFRVKLSKLLDLKQLLAYDSEGQKYQQFANLTMFPMVTFQGQDTTAVSSKLKRSGVTDMNRFLDTTAPRSGASMLSSSMTTSARVHTKTSPLRNFTADYTYTVGDILDIFNVSKRTLFACDSEERGEQCPYYQVNDNLGYFCDKRVKPDTNYHLSQLVTLALKSSSIKTLPTGAEPTTANLAALDTNTSWKVVESKTVAKAFPEATASDIMP